MRFIKGYLIITSVFLHLALLVFLVWIVPFYSNAVAAGREWANSSSNAKEAVVDDVCIIEQDGLKYKGYKLSYNGDTLYTMGTGTDDINPGDTVKVMIVPHPYGPLKSLLVTVMKKEIPSDRKSVV